MEKRRGAEKYYVDHHLTSAVYLILSLYIHDECLIHGGMTDESAFLL